MSVVEVSTRSNNIGADIERVLVQGDLSKLTPEQRTEYYAGVCNSLGLNPLTRPFDYITLNNKLTLYAKKDATDQLRKIHGVSIQITSREQIGDVYAVTARATDNSGRSDESMGAVSIKGLGGEAMANALMKAETKAKRRATLSICGMGLLDETELETIPASAMQPHQAPVVAPPAMLGEPKRKSEAVAAAVVDDPDEFEAAVPERPQFGIFVTEVRKVKDGPVDDDGVPSWTLYAVKTSDGQEYTSFSTSVYAEAKAAQTHKRPVSITAELKTAKNGKQSNVITNLEVLA